MEFYRGDSRPPCDWTLDIGFAAIRPMLPEEARQWLVTQLVKHSGDVPALCQTLRQTRDSSVIATAIDAGGAFLQCKYLYKIRINTLHFFELGSEGPGRQIHNPLVYRGAFMIRDHFLYLAAKIIGIGHGMVCTKEATFLTTIPRTFIKKFKMNSGNWQDMPPAPQRRRGPVRGGVRDILKVGPWR
jgi:hypothetical protein